MKSYKKNGSKRTSRSQRRENNKNIKNSPMDFISVEDEYYEDQRQINIKPIYPIGKNQSLYQQSFKTNTITFGVGCTGTGKSLLAGDYAAQQLKDGEVDKIIFIRPLIEAGKELGALPGELSDKTLPFIKPFLKILQQRLGLANVKKYMRAGIIQAEVLNFLRGETFENCVVILDEAENTTPKQMRMFLTRLGKNCKLIVNGDIVQQDIYGLSGLEDVLSRFKFSRVSSVGIIEFTSKDIVRHGLIKEIILAYDS